MRWSIPLTFAAAMLVGGYSTAEVDKPSSDKQLQFKISVFEGDPLGSREAGTLKVLAEPRLVALENHPFSFFSGSEMAVPDGPKGVQFIEVGRMIKGKGTMKDGKVSLDITLANTTVGEGRTDERIQLHTESTRTITTVKFGEVVKLRWTMGSADKQAWAELSVEEVKP